VVARGGKHLNPRGFQRAPETRGTREASAIFKRMENVVTERLSRLVSAPDQDIDLAEAALLIATEEYPALDVEAYLKQLDELAQRVQQRLSSNPDIEETVVTLNEVLFEEQGFSGNTADFYDPRNSFLNEVLDRKLGIPITLSILYMEIGRRVGLALEGVSFPGHFLVKFATDEGDVVLDPFAGGMPLSEEDLLERLHETVGDETAIDTSLGLLLGAAGKKEILVRMLRNLKVVYLQREEHDRALTVMNRILTIQPELADEVRDRGDIFERLECFRAAAADFHRYLRLCPEAADAQDVRRRLIALEQSAARLN
jgi:regulator of sirC expression with transglutaminase-like and TPR domain